MQEPPIKPPYPQEELRKINMIIYTEKTKYTRIGRKNDCADRVLRLGGVEIEQVSDFKYLGSPLNEYGWVDGRIKTAGRCFCSLKTGFLGRKEITKHIKKVIYKNTFLPILPYASESWILTTKHKWQI